MDKLKLLIACGVLVVLIAQVKLDSAPQRKYFSGTNAIKARQEAAAAGQVAPVSTGNTESENNTQGGICTGGICTMRAPSLATVQQQAREQALREQIAAQQKAMDEQAEALRKMQEDLELLKSDN